MSRIGTAERSTAETSVRVRVELDGSGTADVGSGIGFFDHMLTLLARHALIDLEVHAQGDTHVDEHHTVEDVGL
ncbi:MAG TPA: imidazoleglycerol-phosphate dehydratase, partial [Candidatus Limnocylindria bacterium]|nr:imidazoleglycerol-phosphate dehydratase [Candidatus Limnocylindria bacterium]